MAVRACSPSEAEVGGSITRAFRFEFATRHEAGQETADKWWRWICRVRWVQAWQVAGILGSFV